MPRLRQFALFVLVGGLAALVNVGARIVLSRFVGYEASIVLAFPVAMTVAFALNRQFVFDRGGHPVPVQYLRFFLVNLVALIQVLAVSLVCARLVLPALGIVADADTAGHAIGVVSTAFTSFVFHSAYTFVRRADAHDEGSVDAGGR